MTSSYHSPFLQKKKAAHRRLTASLLMSLPMKSAVPVRETPPPESPVLTPFSTRKPASVKDFPASRAALLCPGTNRRNLPCQQLEIVLSRDRHVGSNPTVSATRLSLDACRVQALFLCPNERLASQPLQTDRVSKKIPNADAFGIFSFRFSRFAPPPPYLHSSCVQPLHQNDCENPAVHIQAAAMSAEKVSPVEKRRPSLLEYSLS